MKRLLLVEDDQNFAEALAGEFSERGYDARIFHKLKDLRAESLEAEFAIVDLKLQGESGLEAVAHIRDVCPSCKVLVLTGYGSIATAVQAVKLGAVNYVSKPASVDTIERALLGLAAPEPEEGEQPSLHRHEREYIEKVVADYSGNISQAAKALGIHRQSLQRKLRKFT